MRTPLLLAFALLFIAACQPREEQPAPPAAPSAPAAAPAADVPARTASVEEASDFTLPDTRGGTHSLADYAGQYVVLEWLNYDCPFVRKHYEGENMQATQRRWTDEGVTWLSIVSSAPGKQGHFPNDEMNRRTEQHGGRQTAILMDESGQVGRAYGARTTPQMVVISPEGEILYNGAIDDRPTPNAASLEGATNYVNQVLTEAMAGQPISVSATQPYGCEVKY